MKKLIRDLKQMDAHKLTILVVVGIGIILAVVGSILEMMMYVKIWNHLS